MKVKNGAAAIDRPARFRELVDEEDVSLLHEIRAALARRRRKASVAPLNCVAAAASTFAEKGLVRGYGSRRWRCSGAGGSADPTPRSRVRSGVSCCEKQALARLLDRG